MVSSRLVVSHVSDSEKLFWGDVNLGRVEPGLSIFYS